MNAQTHHTLTGSPVPVAAFDSREARLLRRIELAKRCNMGARAEVYEAMLDGTDKADPHFFRGLKESMAAEEDGRNMSVKTAQWTREIKTIDMAGVTQ